VDVICRLESGREPSLQINIVCGISWEATIDIVVRPPQTVYKHPERCKDVTVHIRDSADSNFIAVHMVLDSANLNRGECYLYWKAGMKPVPCDSNIEYVEYYIDFSIVKYGHYNVNRRTDCYRVPVSKK
jgi:hypothetical protein